MDLKTSLLIYNQLPEFVREEYPLFVSFLESYYEFLEEEKYTGGLSQKNDLIQKLKDLKYISDIDYSLDQFEDQFFNTFAESFPKDIRVPKEFLLKNILPLYQSKGTVKSFQFLFRILFGEEIEVEYPRQQILKSSDGKWAIENILRTELEIYNEYISDGTRSVYYLPYELDDTDIQIYVNGVLFNDFYVRKENRKIIFNTIPEINAKIKIDYNTSFNTNFFRNRQLRGLKSGTTTIIEKIARRNIAGLNFYQFFVDERNISGAFINGEIVETTIIDELGNVIPFYLQTLSDVLDIRILQPGSNYSVGDVAILRGDATQRSVAVVDSVSSGKIESILVKIGNFGAGYKLDNEVYAVGYDSNVFSAVIDAVDDSGSISPSTFSYNNIDYISDYLSINISDPDYGFPSENVLSENLDTVIGDALTLSTITNIGPATNVSIIISQISSNSNIELLANSTLLFDDVRISDYNAIGTIAVVQSGNGYSVGDEIIFTNTEYFSGQGATAVVSAVNSTGGITRVTVTNGGSNYKKEFLPVLSVDSSGNGAQLIVEHFMGQDVEFDYVRGDGIAGKIISIKVLDPGKGYTVTPTVDLTLSGDGNATALANIRSSLVKLPGRWINQDGLLSSDEIRMQGKDYYIDFSYVISSRVEFQRYKNLVKELLNPSGFVNYAKYLIFDSVDTETNYIVFDEFSRQIAGTVNVANGSFTVIGTNTYFEVANTIGLLSEGTYILVNSEIRIVNSIINNTTITVSESYEFDANDQLVTIVIKPYRAIVTEYFREVAITLEGPRTIVLTTEDEY
jgi:hypothetical protein